MADADSILVARYSGTRRKGLVPPGTHWIDPDGTDRGPHTYDWNYPKGHPENTYGLKARDEIVSWYTALTDVYEDDRYFSPSVLYGPDGAPLAVQPRLTQASLPWLAQKGYSVRIRVLAADVDCPGHRVWTPDARDQWAEVMARLPPCVGYYETLKGARPWVVIDRPLSPAELGGGWVVRGSVRLSGALGGFFEMLLDAGLAYEKNDRRPYLDIKCHDFYRAYRLPHVRRDMGDGETLDYRSPSFRVDVPPMAPPVPSVSVSRRVLIHSSGDPTKSLAAVAFRHASMLGDVCGPGKVKAQCPFEGGHSSGKRFDSSTIIFAASSSLPAGHIHCSHASCEGRTQMEFLLALPEAALCAAIEEFGVSLEEIPVDAPQNDNATPLPTAIPARDASDAILKLLRRLRSDQTAPGPYLIESGCGSGKGWGTRMAAAERAGTQFKNPSPTTTRSPPHSATVILLPTTDLCKQFKDEFDAAGVPCFRDRGTVDKDHLHLCAYPHTAEILNRSGLSVRENLCNGGGLDKYACSHRDTCQAYNALYGDPKARVTVAPQTLAHRYASKPESVLVVVDEPPPPIVTTRLDLDEMRAAERALKVFTNDTAAVVAPLLSAAISYTESTFPEDRATSKPEHLLAALRDRLPDELLDAAVDVLAGWVLEHNGQQVPSEPHDVIRLLGKLGANLKVRPSEIGKVRGVADRASQVASAAKVLRSIAVAAAAPHLAMAEVALAVKGRRTSKALVLTHVNPVVYAVLLRAAPTAWTDAGMSMQVDVYQAIIGAFVNLKDPAADPQRLTVLRVKDGADGTDRALLLTKHATRSTLLPGGKVCVPAVAAGLRLIAAWVNQDPSTREVLIGTFKAVRDHIEAAAAAANDSPIKDALALFPRRPAFCHYGGVRGLNRWQGADGKVVEFNDVDAVATLGDHRQDFNQVERELAPGLDLDAAVRARAAAEHEQVHGRARDPQRTRPARHAHVGEVAPRDWISGSYICRPVWLSTGRVAREVGMAPEELKRLLHEFGGTQTEFCSLCKVQRSALSMCLAGKRTIDAETAARFRAIEPLPPEMQSRRVSPDEARSVIDRGGGCRWLADRLGSAVSTFEAYYAGEKTMPRGTYVRALSWVTARPTAA